MDKGDGPTAMAGIIPYNLSESLHLKFQLLPFWNVPATRNRLNMQIDFQRIGVWF